MPRNPWNNIVFTWGDTKYFTMDLQCNSDWWIERDSRILLRRRSSPRRFGTGNCFRSRLLRIASHGCRRSTVGSPGRRTRSPSHPLGSVREQTTPSRGFHSGQIWVASYETTIKTFSDQNWNKTETWFNHKSHPERNHQNLALCSCTDTKVEFVDSGHSTPVLSPHGGMNGWGGWIEYR